MKKNLETVKANMMERIDAVTARLQALEQIKRVYKKDGTPFKTLAKNFTGCTFKREGFADSRPEIHVSFMVGHRYEEETVHCWEYLDEKKYNPEGRTIYGGGCLRKWFELTPDEIEQRVAEMVANTRARKARLEAQLAETEDIFTTFSEAIEKAFAEMTAKAGKNTALYYECRNYADSII